MDILLVSFFIIYVVLIAVYWKKKSQLIRASVVGCLVTVTLLSYPLWGFAKYRQKVDVPFESGNCSEAIKNASIGLQKHYSAYSNFLIAQNAGFTPKFFFLSIIGICEYRQGEYGKSVQTLMETLEYAKQSSYDFTHIDKTRQLLEKAIKKDKEIKLR